MNDPGTPAVHYAGIDLPGLGAGELAMEAVVLMKVLDASGAVRYREFKSATLHHVEALGMATTFTDTCRGALMRGARPQ